MQHDDYEVYEDDFVSDYQSDKEFVSKYIEKLWSFQSASRVGINSFYLIDYSYGDDGLVDRIFIQDSRKSNATYTQKMNYFDMVDVAGKIASELRDEDKNEHTIRCGMNDDWIHMVRFLRDLKDTKKLTKVGDYDRMEALKEKEAKKAVKEEPKQKKKQKMSI